MINAVFFERRLDMMNAIRQLLQLKGGDLWMISPDASVFEALRRMADKDVGALLVMYVPK